MLSAVFGGTLLLLVSAFWSLPAERSGSSPIGVGLVGSGGGETTTTEPPKFEAAPGTCMNWAEPDSSDMREVNCDEPHLLEVTGKVDLWARFGPKAPYPDKSVWEEVASKNCTEIAESHLGGPLDPNGRFKVSTFPPTKASWENGNRTLHCALQRPGPAGQLYRFTGKVAELDQSNVHEPGTCLGISGTSVSSLVDCSKRHSSEITGVVDLSEKFPDAFPPIKKQDEFLATRCKKITGEYAGSPKAAGDKGLAVYWDNIPKESWQTGSHKVNCKVGATLKEGGLAPITGSVKGKVSVGDKPAPTTSPSPGVPANRPR